MSVSVSKDTSAIGYGIENLKKLDVEAEYKMLSSKPEVLFQEESSNKLITFLGRKKISKGIRSNTLHINEVYSKDFIKCFQYFFSRE